MNPITPKKKNRCTYKAHIAFEAPCNRSSQESQALQKVHRHVILQESMLKLGNLFSNFTAPPFAAQSLMYLVLKHCIARTVVEMNEPSLGTQSLIM